MEQKTNLIHLGVHFVVKRHDKTGGNNCVADTCNRGETYGVSSFIFRRFMCLDIDLQYHKGNEKDLKICIKIMETS